MATAPHLTIEIHAAPDLSFTLLNEMQKSVSYLDLVLRYAAVLALLGQGIAVVISAYYVAYDDISGGWEFFQAVHLYIFFLIKACVFGLVIAAALLFRRAWRLGITLAITSCVVAFPVSNAIMTNAIKPALQPIAAYMKQRDDHQRAAAYEGEKRADYEALLREFQAPQRVLAVLLDARAPMLILEGGKAVKLYRPGYYMPKEDEAQMEQYLKSEIVGKKVMVQLPPREEFVQIYSSVTRGYSGAIAEAMGRTPRYGVIPALVFLGGDPIHERVVTKASHSR